MVLFRRSVPQAIPDRSGQVSNAGEEGANQETKLSEQTRRRSRRPSMHISGVPDHRRRQHNQNSNCLWQLERAHTTFEGQPLRRNPSAVFPPSELFPDTTDDMQSVRVKHMATGRYLCVVEECEHCEVKAGTAGSRMHHVCTLSGDKPATPMSLSLFVLRPRPAGDREQESVGDSLSTYDVMHLQHHKTGLFLAIRSQNEALRTCPMQPNDELRGVSVCLTTVEYSLTNEVS